MDLLVTLHMDEDGVWIAECPALPGCVSQGATRDEAVENAREAIALCLEVRAERGDPVCAGTVNVQVTARRPIIDIECLSVDERILLAQDLWDSISPDSPELAVSPWMEALLDERLAEHARNPDAGEPWEVVLERLRQRLREGRSDVDA